MTTVARAEERTTPAASARVRPRSAQRSDIQGLRALAVLLVLTYHLWPQQLTGGFVGVDIFFVISGFLITSHLLASPPRRGRDLLVFWSRRIRRLLPASVLVLVVTAVATRFVAPETQWSTTAIQIAAAAGYGVNWLLAADSVDYLAAENAPTAVQHFWSLSVEEQFYLVWPVLLLGLFALAARIRRSSRVVVLAGLGAVVALSFVISVVLTTTDPARAYFVTPTRVWELGIGGLLAAVLAHRAHATARRAEEASVGRSAVPRAVLGWSGLVAIAIATTTYDATTPFPGWAAALPVLGAAAVIAAHAPERGWWSPGHWLGLRPARWVGDVSYSIYLWHWPLVVLVPYATGSDLVWPQKVAIMVGSVLLAAVTKRWVEDRFRSTPARGGLTGPFVGAALAFVLVAGLALAQVNEVGQRARESAARSADASTQPCFGAAALTDASCPATLTGPVQPALSQAGRDKSRAYQDVGGRDCWSYTPRYPQVTCVFGDPAATVDVALVGNSHGGQWLPALEALASRHGWRITTFLASQCAFADVSQALDTDADSAACRSWVDTTAAAVAAGGFDLVVLGNKMSVPAQGKTIASSIEDYRQGYATAIDQTAAGGARVVVLRDTPNPGLTLKSVPDCLATHPTDYGACTAERAAWTYPDPSADAATGLGDPDVTVVDLTDRICRPDRCEGVVGGVVVYFDASHLTATYAATLAPFLDPPLQAALRR